MTIPHITNKQKGIPKLLFRFRYLHSLYIQKFLNHKGKRRINSWLKNLTEKHYIEKMPKKNTFEERTKPSIYFVGINGIRFLKTLDDYSPNVIRKLYKDGTHEKPFISKCLLIADICIHLKKVSRKNELYSSVTNREYASPDSPYHFLEENGLKPDLVVTKEKVKRKTYYLLTVFEETLPRYIVRKRIRSYIDFYFSSEWEENKSKKFPIILFIFPTKADLIYAKRFTRKLMEENQNPKDLHIRFAQAFDVREFGITSEIWEEVK